MFTKDFLKDAFFENFIFMIFVVVLTVLSIGIVKNMQHLHEAEAKCGPMHVHLSVDISPQDVSEAFEVEKNREKALKVLNNYADIRRTMSHVCLPVDRMVLTDIGKYYITGYTSIECGGSTMTASGATVHKGNPTTCAIDPKLHDFGDLFYIPYFDQVYVAEDTGSAVKGKHLDLFFYYDEYNYALSITGYYKVYSVEYVTDYISADYFNITDMVWEVQNENT